MYGSMETAWIDGYTRAESLVWGAALDTDFSKVPGLLAARRGLVALVLEWLASEGDVFRFREEHGQGLEFGFNEGVLGVADCEATELGVSGGARAGCVRVPSLVGS